MLEQCRQRQQHPGAGHRLGRFEARRCFGQLTGARSNPLLRTLDPDPARAERVPGRTRRGTRSGAVRLGHRPVRRPQPALFERARHRPVGQPDRPGRGTQRTAAVQQRLDLHERVPVELVAALRGACCLEGVNATGPIRLLAPIHGAARDVERCGQLRHGRQMMGAQHPQRRAPALAVVFANAEEHASGVEHGDLSVLAHQGAVFADHDGLIGQERERGLKHSGARGWATNAFYLNNPISNTRQPLTPINSYVSCS